MKKIIVAALVLVGAQLASRTSVEAQNPWYAGLGYGYAAGAYGGGFGAYGAQTPFSAQATGMANLVRAQGMYNEANSRAAVNYQQAERQYIENQQQAFNARQSVKRVIQAENAKAHEETRAQFARSEEFLAAHRPPSLTSKQLDPSTGKLNWPITLKASDFDGQRKTLDELFEKRAKYGASSDVSTQIEVKTGELKDSLRGHITKVPLTEYSESRQFLDSMISTVK